MITGALPFEIRNAERERLDHAFVGDAGQAPDLVVVIGHGVTSHWDRPWQTDLAAALAQAGIASLLVSFSGNGVSEGAFEASCPSKESGDLGSVLDALEAWGVRRFVYAGHSMGGAVGVLRASADARIEWLVSLAGMFHVHAFMERTFGHLVPGEGLMLDKPDCVWNSTLAADARRLGSLTSQAAAIHIPWLLVHGDADELVPLQDAIDARAAAGGRPDLVVLPGVDHRFTGAIPAMAGAVVSWLGAATRKE
ncbi:MAG: alpha/beta hydrolase [Acidobacteria bacterium]|nr:alpha/beta hydrolase [Acidobacteriota bacterium]